MKQKLFDLLMSCGQCDIFDEYAGCRKCEYDCTDEGCEKHLTSIMTDDLLNAGVVILPVKPHDTVYTIRDSKIEEWKVYFVGINSCGEFRIHIVDHKFDDVLEFWDRDIGLYLFLTEEDAINELKERKSYEG